MKRLKVMLAIGMAASMLMGCTGVEETIDIEAGADTSVEATEPDAAGEETSSEEPGDISDVALTVPVVKDGVTVLGYDCVDVYFEWDEVQGADGYEVTTDMKASSETEYREGETRVAEVTEPAFFTGAQDEFDFRIKVRSFKGEGSSREYSDWSEPATGTTKGDLRREWDHSYDELINSVADGLKNGFTDEQKSKLDISEVFYSGDDTIGFGYYTKDLDGDGTEELLLCGYLIGFVDGIQGVIYDMYTIQDGKIVQVFNAAQRDQYYLCYNGMIACEESVGADYSTYAFYKYNKGKLDIVESLFMAEKDGTDQPGYYRSDKKPNEDKSNEITFEEYEKIRNQAKYQYQTFSGSDIVK